MEKREKGAWTPLCREENWGGQTTWGLLCRNRQDGQTQCLYFWNWQLRGLVKLSDLKSASFHLK